MKKYYVDCYGLDEHGRNGKLCARWNFDEFHDALDRYVEYVTAFSTGSAPMYIVTIRRGNKIVRQSILTINQ